MHVEYILHYAVIMQIYLSEEDALFYNRIGCKNRLVPSSLYKEVNQCQSCTGRRSILYCHHACDHCFLHLKRKMVTLSLLEMLIVQVNTSSKCKQLC